MIRGEPYVGVVCAVLVVIMLFALVGCVSIDGSVVNVSVSSNGSQPRLVNSSVPVVPGVVIQDVGGGG